MPIHYSCPHCGSDEILIDAYINANDPGDVRTFDQMVCGDCGYDGYNFVETQVPDEPTEGEQR